MNAIPPTIGSRMADPKTYAAFHNAMRNLHRQRELGDGPRLNAELDKRTLGLEHGSEEGPDEDHDDVHFDYEISRPPYSGCVGLLIGLGLTAAVAVEAWMIF